MRACRFWSLYHLLSLLILTMTTKTPPKGAELRKGC